MNPLPAFALMRFGGQAVVPVLRSLGVGVSLSNHFNGFIGLYYEAKPRGINLTRLNQHYKDIIKFLSLFKIDMNYINFKHYYEIFDLLEKNLPLSEPVIQQSKKSGCFIATAVYGSPYENEVLILKKFRDNWLMKYKLGEIFVKLYYWFSPPIANLIAKSNSLRRITKSILIIPLLKIVNSLKSKEK